MYQAFLLDYLAWPLDYILLQNQTCSKTYKRLFLQGGVVYKSWG